MAARTHRTSGQLDLINRKSGQPQDIFATHRLLVHATFQAKRDKALGVGRHAVDVPLTLLRGCLGIWVRPAIIGNGAHRPINGTGPQGWNSRTQAAVNPQPLAVEIAPESNARVIQQYAGSRWVSCTHERDLPG
ncbi:hypothetical protein A33K_18725 [Burkholderia humptydooensis MSMB43]|uniref:Uncharacterized protein n=1 Tax=Burkholderia humptydooensis MSMB43 TaxID=441157 RepID=A0ABN0FX62_9BURK|nr:hypothetical protein A33K_18725 [Burkholderia humptydooensis MSMB43]